MALTKPNVTLSQPAAITAYTNEVIALPTAKLTDAAGNDITSNFTVSYQKSGQIASVSWYKGYSLTNYVQMPSSIVTGQTIRMTYTPNSDVASTYSAVTQEFTVTLKQAPTTIPTTMSLPDGNSMSVNTDTRFTITSALVEDDLGNNVSAYFSYGTTKSTSLTGPVGSSDIYLWTYGAWSGLIQGIGTVDYVITASCSGFQTVSQTLHVTSVYRDIVLQVGDDGGSMQGQIVKTWEADGKIPTITPYERFTDGHLAPPSNLQDISIYIGFPKDNVTVTGPSWLQQWHSEISYNGVPYQLWLITSSINSQYGNSLTIDFSKYKESYPRVIYVAWSSNSMHTDTTVPSVPVVDPNVPPTTPEIPWHKVADGESIAPGQVLVTTNIPTNINMIVGGWTDAAATNNNKTDSWQSPRIDLTGGTDGNLTLDGFKYAAGGNQDPLNEKFGYYDLSIANGSHKPWELPCRGSYLRFEPHENGTLMVYVLQNGSLAYMGETDETTIKNSYKLKFRPLFITDETGNSVTLDDAWAAGPTLLNGTYSGSEPGSYTQSIYRAKWNDSNVKSVLAANNITPNTMGYSDCAFDLSDFNGRTDDLAKLMTAWKQYDGTDATSRQKVIRYSQGYGVLNKGYVRYTFQVKAGKSYFVFMNGSKLGFAGYAFVPTYWKSTALADYTVTLNDNDNYATVFSNAVANRPTLPVPQYGTTNSNELADVSVKLNRTFTADKWTGMTLPFSLSDTQFREVFGNDAMVITYDSVARDSAYFTQHVYHQIVAGYPFFVRPSQSVAANTVIAHITMEQGIGAKPMSDADGNYTAVPLLAPATAPASSYVFAGVNVYHLQSALAMPTYRAYLRPASSNTESFIYFGMSRASYYDVPNDDVVTLVRDVSTIPADDAESIAPIRRGVYNLQGVYLGDKKVWATLPSGIYIVDGVKKAK